MGWIVGHRRIGLREYWRGINNWWRWGIKCWRRHNCARQRRRERTVPSMDRSGRLSWRLGSSIVKSHIPDHALAQRSLGFGHDLVRVAHDLACLLVKLPLV